MSDKDIKTLEKLFKEFIKVEIDKGNVYKLEALAESLQRIRYSQTKMDAAIEKMDVENRL